MLVCWLWHCAATAVALQRHERVNAFKLVDDYDDHSLMSRGVHDSALYKCTFTYLLTYFINCDTRWDRGSLQTQNWLVWQR